jgi:glutathione S-transferase
VSGQLKLYGFTGSNSVDTGRLMLEHKGLEYDFVKLPPGVHAPTMLVLGREDVELLPARMDKIDAWIADGVLDGAELNAADYQIAVNVSALLLSEDVAPFIEWRPAAALARRVLPEYGGRIGPVVPADWMAKLRAAADGSQTGRAVGV